MWQPPSSQGRLHDMTRQRQPIANALRGPGEKRHRLKNAEASNTCEVKTASATDHNDERISIAWMRPRCYYAPLTHANAPIDWKSHEAQDGKFPPFPIQVYILTSAARTLRSEDFPTEFANWLDTAIRPLTKPKVRAHFEFYSPGFHDVLACLAHQRIEVTRRCDSGAWPHLPWRDSSNGSGNGWFVLVVDNDKWKTNGLIFVTLDPTNGYPSTRLDLAGRDEDDLRATRISKTVKWDFYLHTAWEHAGSHDMQLDLDRRNEGGHSPVRYPAVDPLTHRDVHHEQLASLDEIQGLHVYPSANEANEEDDDNDDDDTPIANLDTTRKELNAATRRILYQSSKHLPHLKSEIYEGHAGWEATSIWNSILSNTRPPFAVTLYLSSDLLPFKAQSIFALLDREGLHEIPWTLDIIRNVPNVESAFRHYVHEVRHRKLARCQSRSACQQMLLNKIAAAILPEELLQVIEGMIDIPPIPDFSPSPWEGFHDKFLYLDRSTQMTGPRVVYFNHYSDSCFHSKNRRELVQPSTHTECLTTKETPNLVIMNPNYWKLVSDDIHRDWSLCSPRLEVPACGLPHLSIRLHLPQVCIWDSLKRELDAQHHAKASLTLHAVKPITILHTQDPRYSHIRSDLMLEGAFEFLDLTTNLTIDFPTTSHALPPLVARRECTWSQHPFVKYQLSGAFGGDTLHTIEPGAVHAVKHDGSEQPLGLLSRSFWDFAYSKGRLQHDHEYVMRVKPGFTVPRWTYGSVPVLEGPYNLPPIAVHGENECRFRFHVK